jgi:aspartate/methionine/tyrosine aminotransferase
MSINATRGALETAAYSAPGGLVADLGIGNPLSSPPAIGVEVRAREQRENIEAHHYAPKEGMAETHRAARDFSAKVDGVALAREQVMISECGTAWLLRLLAERLLKTTGPFTALIPQPYYGKHLSALTAPGVKIAMADYENGRPYAETLEAAVREHRPRVIVESAVRNPTTAIVEGADCEAAVAIARKYGAILFMDDAYRHVYRTRRGPIASVLRIPGAMDGEVVATISFSKGFRWPGLRGGLLLGHPGVLAMVQAEKDGINEGGDPAAQLAMAALLNHPEVLEETRRGYDHACPTLVGFLRKHGWDTAGESDASIFCWFPIPSRWKAQGLDSTQLCAATAARGVVMYDDRKFGGNGSKIRLCMRGDEDQWRRAAELLGKLIENPKL